MSIRFLSSPLSSPSRLLLLMLLIGPIVKNQQRASIIWCRAMSTVNTPTKSYPYEPPKWTWDMLENVPPHGRLSLANLPTPLYRIEPPRAKEDAKQENTSSIMGTLAKLGVTLYMKRDDMTGGVETGGNKLRKLEFLMADALASDCNSVVTIGGEQSNHCRATAAVSRMIGLEPHLILRTKRANSVAAGKEKFGTTGNVMFDRMVGSNMYTCTPGEYGRVGSDALVERVCSYISKADETNKPYPIPVGGSNWIGSWGYINAVDEVMQQWAAMKESNGSVPSLDHVVFACGSGGTAAGICLGMALVRPRKPQVHAIGVCDSPDYFYDYVASIADDMGLVLPSYLPTVEFIKENMIAHQGKGLGYAVSTPEELEFCMKFAIETGIVLDPVYSGKALYQFLTHVVQEDPEAFRGKNILFWHTGGSLGIYDKEKDLALLEKTSPVMRLDVYGKDDADEGSVSI